MRAIVLAGNGDASMLQVADVPKPAPAPGQLLVQVQAVGVNPIDYKLRQTGAFGFSTGAILGFDCAGVVEAVGPGVREYKRGDAVFYSPDFSGPGAYGEYHCVSADIVAFKPKCLDFIEAAAIPLAGMTAWDSIMDRGALRLGETVLIHGAAGGVGSIAVQLAHAAGAYVFATASPANIGLVRSLGADYVIDRTKEDFAQVIRAHAPRGAADLVFDAFGADLVSRSMPVVRPLGRIVTIVNPSGDLAVGYRKNISLHYVFLQRRRSTLEALSHLLARRLLKPVISHVLPLEQAADAHRMLEAGGGFGKIVLKVTHAA